MATSSLQIHGADFDDVCEFVNINMQKVVRRPELQQRFECLLANPDVAAITFESDGKIFVEPSMTLLELAALVDRAR